MDFSCGFHDNRSSGNRSSIFRVVPISWSYSESRPSLIAMPRFYRPRTRNHESTKTRNRLGPDAFRGFAVSWFRAIGRWFRLSTLVVAAGCGSHADTPRLLPEVSGTLTVDGLAAPVRIIRDR